jgi:hypothetical protein
MMDSHCGTVQDELAWTKTPLTAKEWCHRPVQRSSRSCRTTNARGGLLKNHGVPATPRVQPYFQLMRVAESMSESVIPLVTAELSRPA